MEGFKGTLLTAISPQLALRAERVEELGLKAPNINLGLSGLSNKIASFTDKIATNFKKSDKVTENNVESLSESGVKKVDGEGIKSNTKLEHIRDLSLRQLSELKTTREQNKIFESRREQLDRQKQMSSSLDKKKEIQSISKIIKDQSNIDAKKGKTSDVIRRSVQIKGFGKVSQNSSFNSYFLSMISLLNNINTTSKKSFELEKFKNRIESDSDLSKSKIYKRLDAEDARRNSQLNKQNKLLSTMTKTLKILSQKGNSVEDKHNDAQKKLTDKKSLEKTVKDIIVTVNTAESKKWSTTDVKEASKTDSLFKGLFRLVTNPSATIKKMAKDKFDLHMFNLAKKAADYTSKVNIARDEELGKRIRGDKVNFFSSLGLTLKGLNAGLLNKFFRNNEDFRKTPNDNGERTYSETSWTSKDNVALTLVIPTWLSKIYKALTGKSEFWDYNTASMRNAKSVFSAGEAQRKEAILMAEGELEYLLKSSRDERAILDAQRKVRTAYIEYEKEKWDDEGTRSAVKNLIDGSTVTAQTELQRKSFERLKRTDIIGEAGMKEMEDSYKGLFLGALSGRLRDTFKKVFHNSAYFEDLRFVSEKRAYTDNDSHINKILTGINKVFNNLDQTKLETEEQLEALRTLNATKGTLESEAYRRNLTGKDKEDVLSYRYASDKSINEDDVNGTIGLMSEDLFKTDTPSNTLVLIYELLLDRLPSRESELSGDEETKGYTTYNKDTLKEQREKVRKDKQFNVEVKDSENIAKQTSNSDKMLELYMKNHAEMLNAIDEASPKKSFLSSIGSFLADNFFKITGFLGALLGFGKNGLLDKLFSKLGFNLDFSFKGIGELALKLLATLGSGVLSVLKFVGKIGSDLLGSSWKSITKVFTTVTKKIGDVFKWLSNVGSDAFKWIKDLGFKAFDKVKSLLGFGSDIASKALGKGVAKGVSKKIPVVGALLGIAYGIDKMIDGHIMEGVAEITSGLLGGLAPGLGTAGSVGLDAWILSQEMARGGGDTITSNNISNKTNNVPFETELSKLLKKDGGDNSTQSFDNLMKGIPDKNINSSIANMSSNNTKINNVSNEYSNSSSSVQGAINEASKVSGVPVEMLRDIAYVESGFNPNAKNSESSASGLFQITGGTWDYLMGKYKNTLGLSGTENRFDPRANSLLGAMYVKENYNLIKGSKDNINSTDLYMAHFLGGGGAQTFFKALKNNPEELAYKLFPADFSNSNKNIFFENGSKSKPRTVAGVYALMAKKMNDNELANQVTQGNIMFKSSMTGVLGDGVDFIEDMASPVTTSVRDFFKDLGNKFSPQKPTDIAGTKAKLNLAIKNNDQQGIMNLLRSDTPEMDKLREKYWTNKGKTGSVLDMYKSGSMGDLINSTEFASMNFDDVIDENNSSMVEGVLKDLNMSSINDSSSNEVVKNKTEDLMNDSNALLKEVVKNSKETNRILSENGKKLNKVAPTHTVKELKNIYLENQNTVISTTGGKQQNTNNSFVNSLKKGGLSNIFPPTVSPEAMKQAGQ